MPALSGRWWVTLLALLWVSLAAAQQPGTLILTPDPVNVGSPVTARYTINFDAQTAVMEWGDGTRESVPVGSGTATHTYTQAGGFVVRLIANSQVLVAEAPITVNQSWTCTVTASPNPVSPGGAVTFNLSFNLAANNAFTLDFGDGQNAPVNTGNGTTASITHTYASPGIYLAKVDQDTLPLCNVSVRVQAAAPTLSVTPDSVLVGAAVTATPGNIAAGASYTLKWGDGSTETVTSNTPRTHVYTAVGTYVVTLGTAGVPPATARVTVRAPSAGLQVAPNPAGVGEQVTASASGLVPTLPYTLDWVDGSTATLTGAATASARHAYTSPGVYVVKLSADGVAPVTVSLTVRAPTGTVSVTPNPALVGQTVTASAGNLLANLPYTLDWGDGAPTTLSGQTSRSATHTYAQPGVYVVKLSADGIAPITVSVTVKLPAPTLDVTPNPALVGQEVTATPSQLFQGVAYTLDWGDGTTSAITGPLKHKFSAAGVYVVKLSADGLAPVTVSLNVKLPVPTLDLAPNPANVNETVTATLGQLVSGVAYSLDWGDGTTAPATASMKRAFKAPGVYVVKLTAEGLGSV